MRPARGIAAALLAFLTCASAGRAAALQPNASSVALRPRVIAEGLPMIIGGDHLGLGAEAGRLVAWILSHPGPLVLRAADLTLVDAKAGTFRLTPVMARTLARMNQWHGLEAPADHPITHAQLSAGALSKASVERIKAIFEAAIGRGVRVGSTWLTPETGGEATLDRELRLAEAIDPRWSTIQELAKVADDPKLIAALCESRTEEVALVDTHGLLKVAVARLRLASPGSLEEVRRALVTVARNTAPTYSLGPEEQLSLVTSRDWQGRYVGGWHTHAPHDANGQWTGGDVPSFEDMQNAIQFGQYLTLSFQPDGFDLYDASALADAKRVDLSLLKVIRYRSPSWREHFKALRPGPR
jgi:hypothetical protein